MSDEEPVKIEPPPQPHRCAVGHLQPHAFALTYKHQGGVDITTGPVCIACLYAYVGRNFRNRPVSAEDEA